jgi:hypothetical protein
MYEYRHSFSGARLCWTVAECLDSTYGPYVVTLHTQRCDKHRWQGACKKQYVKERILIWVRCICSWHARDLWISTQIAPRPESHGNCSQMKAFCSDHIWGRRKGQHRRWWENQCWRNHTIFSSYMVVKSLHAVYSSRIYRKHHTTIISDWHVIAELQLLCWRTHLMTWFHRLVQSEFRFLRYFTDVWNIHQQDDFIFRNVYSLF